MATFTDLSQSTQAGDPVVSILTSGLDRNQIAAFEGDPTATALIQAQNDAFTPASITTNKLGAHSNGSSLAGVESIEIMGDWGTFTGGTAGESRVIIKRFLHSGTYRFVGGLKFSSSGGGSTIGNAKLVLSSSVSGINISSSTVGSLNTYVYIDSLVTVVAGESLTLSGINGDYDGGTQPQMTMTYKLFANDSNVESPKTNGWRIDRVRVGSVIGNYYDHVYYPKHIDWTSTPYPGDIS